MTGGDHEVGVVGANLLVLLLLQRQSLRTIHVRAFAEDDELGRRSRRELLETLVELSEEGLVAGKSFFSR